MPIIKRYSEEAEQYNAYLDRLSRSGIKSLGSGRTGTVFQHPTLPNVAVKVYARQRRENSHKWYKWCESHQQNPFVPKIYHLRKEDNLQFYEKDSTSFHIVFMEKLERVTFTTLLRFVQKNELQAAMVLASENKGFFIGPQIEIDKVQDKNLRAVLTTVRKLSLSQRFASGDMHRKNFMRRGKQLVFTDPVA